MLLIEYQVLNFEFGYNHFCDFLSLRITLISGLPLTTN